MTVLSGFLIVFFITIGALSAYQDFRKGIIPNKYIVVAIIVGISTNIIECIVYKEYACLFNYFKNLSIMTIISVLLWVSHYWAAGDSKLVIALNAIIPAVFYDSNALLAPGLMALIYVFLIAYVYVIGDSIYRAFKKKSSYKSSITIGSLKLFARNYFIGFIYLRALSWLLGRLLKESYFNNRLLFAFVNIFAVLLIYKVELFTKTYSLILVAGLNIYILFVDKINPRSFILYILLLVVLIIRRILNGYNYESIPTESVEVGMVLSQYTVGLFSFSRVKGLPHMTYEDMRSRLTKEEVDAIRRWENSKYGKKEIIIVRKIPFAIFISLGELIYLARVIWR